MIVRMQINQRGAWSNLIQIDPDYYDEAEVRAAAVALAGILRSELRTLDPDKNVLSHWSPQTGWVEDPFGHAK